MSACFVAKNSTVLGLSKPLLLLNSVTNATFTQSMTLNMSTATLGQRALASSSKVAFKKCLFSTMKNLKYLHHLIIKEWWNIKNAYFIFPQKHSVQERLAISNVLLVDARSILYGK